MGRRGLFEVVVNRSRQRHIGGDPVQFTVRFSFIAPTEPTAHRRDLLSLQLTQTYIIDTTCTDIRGFGVKGFYVQFSFVPLRHFKKGGVAPSEARSLYKLPDAPDVGHSLGACKAVKLFLFWCICLKKQNKNQI